MTTATAPGRRLEAGFTCVAQAWQVHESELRGYLRHRMVDRDAADDMLQDVFVKAMRQGQGFCDLDNPRAWLARQSGRRARANAARIDAGNAEFRQGLIEQLPVADAEVDVIISNCVINLSPDKSDVFTEAFRVLKSGGRLAISDVVAFADLPEDVRGDLTLYSGCMAGASMISELIDMLDASGFGDIAIIPKDDSKAFIEDWAPGRNITDYVVSATIAAIKP